MSPFIGAAQTTLLETIEALSAKSGIDLRVGLVEYRDHPPQETSFVTRHYPLTADLKEMQGVVNSLRADGGGDTPEAVYDGVQEAAILTEWRAHSCRFIMLVGDAPPHGYNAPHETDERRTTRSRRQITTEANVTGQSCHCGLDAAQATAAAEEKRVTVHALPMSEYAETIGAFTELAKLTGGECATASDSGTIVRRIGEMLDAEFRNLHFDREVLNVAMRLASPDAGEVSQQLGCTRLQTAAALARLGRRGFLHTLVQNDLTEKVIGDE
jgi:hypothetical protein